MYYHYFKPGWLCIHAFLIRHCRASLVMSFVTITRNSMATCRPLGCFLGVSRFVATSAHVSQHFLSHRPIVIIATLSLANSFPLTSLSLCRMFHYISLSLCQLTPRDRMAKRDSYQASTWPIIRRVAPPQPTTTTTTTTATNQPSPI